MPSSKHHYQCRNKDCPQPTTMTVSITVATSHQLLKPVTCQSCNVLMHYEGSTEGPGADNVRPERKEEVKVTGAANCIGCGKLVGFTFDACATCRRRHEERRQTWSYSNALVEGLFQAAKNDALLGAGLGSVRKVDISVLELMEILAHSQMNDIVVDPTARRTAGTNIKAIITNALRRTDSEK